VLGGWSSGRLGISSLRGALALVVPDREGLGTTAVLSLFVKALDVTNTQHLLLELPHDPISINPKYYPTWFAALTFSFAWSVPSPSRSVMQGSSPSQVAILFPPAAVGFLTGCSCDLLINVLLTRMFLPLLVQFRS
jgi:Proteolipid membrane potential modulator